MSSTTTLEEIPFFIPNKQLSCVLTPVHPLTKETQFSEKELIDNNNKS